MLIKFNTTCRLDTTNYFEKDKEYELSDNIAQKVIERGWTYNVKKGRPPETEEQKAKKTEAKEVKEAKAMTDYENKSMDSRKSYKNKK